MDYYPLSDLLYRSVALTDDDKDIVEAYDTDAYGNTLIYDEPGSGDHWFAYDAHQTHVPKCRFIFTGREYDPETQIYYFRARYYCPPPGRWLARDALNRMVVSNLQEYVDSQPADCLDPDGLRPCPATYVKYDMPYRGSQYFLQAVSSWAHAQVALGHGRSCPTLAYSCLKGNFLGFGERNCQYTGCTRWFDIIIALRNGAMPKRAVSYHVRVVATNAK